MGSSTKKSVHLKSISKGFGIADAKRDIPSPYLSANLLSKLTLWYMNNHIWRGFRRPLSPTDIYSVIPSESSAARAKDLDLTWDCLLREEKQKKNSLLKAVLMNDWKLLALSILLMLIAEISKFIQPFLITLLVSYFKGKDYVSESQAWAYAVIMVLLTVVYALFSTYGQYLGQVVAMRMRTSCTALMSRKALSLSSKALGEVSIATVINLLATDVEKFYNAATEFNGLFLGPLVLLAVLMYIAIEVNLSIIPAFVFIFIMTAFRMKIGHMAGLLRLKLAKLSDKRILLMSEIIAAMKTIKAYCWEFAFAERAQVVRSEEVKKAGHVMFLNGLNLNLGVSCDRVVTFLLVLTFIMSGHYVDYKLAVQALTWMKMAQVGLLDFPIGFSMWKQMEASVERMQNFLLAEEFVGYERVRRESIIGSREKVKIVLKNVSASWAIKSTHVTKSMKVLKTSMLKSITTINAIASQNTFMASGAFSLQNINLEVKQGSLLGIVGSVGSGKTSLLLVILGNLPISTGTRRLKGKIAYVSQEPWIRADTVRNNILMGAKMERKRYQTVLRACALQKDIASMKQGDTTLIGDRGSSLSGGQKARISLARAVYKNADIYILDDPFSSLDSKVGTHIFHECVLGLLRSKLVIMATHYVHLLNYTDQVLVLNDGKIAASGTLNEVKKKVDLTDLIKEPLHHVLDLNTDGDVFGRQDSIALVMNLLKNPNIKREHAHVPKKRATPFHVYLSYWRAGSGYILLTIAYILLVANQAMSVTGDWWLVYVLSGGTASYGDKYSSDKSRDYGSNSTDSYHGNLTTPGYNSSSTPGFTVYDPPTPTMADYAAAPPAFSLSDLDLQKSSLAQYAIYVWLGFLFGILSAIFSCLFTVKASKNLYNRMFTKVIWAPMHIFSSDKLGQMMNRFARDTGRMDDIIPITINATSVTTAVMISQLAYICLVNAYIVVATLPFLVSLLVFVLYCIRAIRDTKRLESEFRTPTFEHLNHLLDGLEVVRAYEMEPTLIEESDRLLDRHTAAWHMYIDSMYWMKMRLKCMVSIYLAAVLVIELATPFSAESATSLGLSLAYVVLFMQKIQYFANYSTTLDANMTSVEHVLEYESLPQEEPGGEYTLPPDWPDDPTIEFKSVSLVYPESEDSALKDVSFKIKSGEKVGIIGRTGAGKTSIFNALLHLSDYQGSVLIGGIDTKDIGLHQLRGNITFIPQRPNLHTGTLRYNIDPHNRYSDNQLWDVLEMVHLKKVVCRLPGRLNNEIESGGNIFSRGQKQLLSMARVLLDMNKIMILDEMTAHADKETDVLMHQMLHKEFSDCSVLHISHRIETMIHYDKILMVGEGRLLEFDHPHKLLQNKDSHFYSLVQQLGRKEASWLINRARQSYLGQVSTLNPPHQPELPDTHILPAAQRRKRHSICIAVSEVSRDTIYEEGEEEDTGVDETKNEDKDVIEQVKEREVKAEEVLNQDKKEEMVPNVVEEKEEVEDNEEEQEEQSEILSMNEIDREEESEVLPDLSMNEIDQEEEESEVLPDLSMNEIDQEEEESEVLPDLSMNEIDQEEEESEVLPDLSMNEIDQEEEESEVRPDLSMNDIDQEEGESEVLSDLSTINDTWDDELGLVGEVYLDYLRYGRIGRRWCKLMGKNVHTNDLDIDPVLPDQTSETGTDKRQEESEDGSLSTESLQNLSDQESGDFTSVEKVDDSKSDDWCADLMPGVDGISNTAVPPTVLDKCPVLSNGCVKTKLTNLPDDIHLPDDSQEKERQADEVPACEEDIVLVLDDHVRTDSHTGIDNPGFTEV